MKNDLIRELKSLREQCAGIVSRLDEIIPQCEDTSCGQHKRPLIVPDRCEFITQHAIDRFRERNGSKKSDENICARIKDRIAGAQELELKPKFRVVEMLAHGGHARYFRSADLVFVVQDGFILTAHAGDADRWVPKRPDMGNPITGIPTLATAESSI